MNHKSAFRITLTHFRNAAVAVTAFAVIGEALLDKTWEQLPQVLLRQHRQCTNPATIVGVVFTGNQGRIDEGLNLLKKGEVKTLLISGNDAYLLREPSALPQALELFFDKKAANTRENAANTAQWLARLPLPKICAIELITSAAHMPRSAYLLSKYLKAENLNIPIRPHSIEDLMSNSRSRFREMGKMLLTLIGIEQRDESAYLRPHNVASQQNYSINP